MVQGLILSLSMVCDKFEDTMCPGYDSLGVQGIAEPKAQNARALMERLEALAYLQCAG